MNMARNSGVVFLNWINGFMGIFPFCFPAVLILRLQVWRRRTTSRKKVLRLIQIRCGYAEF